MVAAHLVDLFWDDLVVLGKAMAAFMATATHEGQDPKSRNTRPTASIKHAQEPMLFMSELLHTHTLSIAP